MTTIAEIVKSIIEDCKYTDAEELVERTVRTIQADERQRCADISTAVFLNRGTCKQATDHGKGWNAACADINHRITTDGRCITQSPIPALILALQAVKADGIRLTADTLTAVCEALDEIKNPKEL